LSTELLSEYIETFYGYGNWEKSNFWFVGIEEGGGNKIENIAKRLESWSELGKTDLLDCKLHHEKSGSTFNKDALHSRTWTRLILTKLGFESDSYMKKDILDIQFNHWGQLDSDNLLIELFPLPSPGLSKWGYPDWVDLNSNLDFLKDRASYKAKVIEQRIAYIQSKIHDYKPKIVLFYSKSMEEYWNKIIGTSELQTKTVLGRYKIRVIQKDGTCFVQCAQPTYIRAYAFWIQLGKIIKELLANHSLDQ
jgi:hypothetical protein